MTIISIEGHPFVTFERIGDYYKCKDIKMYHGHLQKPFLHSSLDYTCILFFELFDQLYIYRVLHHKPAKSICLLRIQGKLIFQIHIQLQGKVRI